MSTEAGSFGALVVDACSGAVSGRCIGSVAFGLGFDWVRRSDGERTRARPAASRSRTNSASASSALACWAPGERNWRSNSSRLISESACILEALILHSSNRALLMQIAFARAPCPPSERIAPQRLTPKVGVAEAKPRRPLPHIRAATSPAIASDRPKRGDIALAGHAASRAPARCVVRRRSSGSSFC